MARQSDFFWETAALTNVVGVAAGALAAMAGAADLPRARARASRLALTHASLMSSAWVLATISLVGRVSSDYQAVMPPPWWAVSAGVAAVPVMIVGAWCGGEMVYGRGIGVREDVAIKAGRGRDGRKQQGRT
jgi:uncharacterized membrane protein